MKKNTNASAEEESKNEEFFSDQDSFERMDYAKPSPKKADK